MRPLECQKNDVKRAKSKHVNLHIGRSFVATYERVPRDR